MSVSMRRKWGAAGRGPSGQHFMSSSSLLPGSMSSGEFHIVAPERVTEIERRHDLVAAFLKERSLGGLLLTLPSNFAWFTGGADSTRGNWNDVTSALFITPEARVVLTRNTDSGQLFDRHIPALGFQLKERTWQEDRDVLMGDLCRGRTVASDAPYGECVDVSPHLAGMRLPLARFEAKNLRELGRLVSHAIEATARTFRRGDSEAEVAGQLVHRLMRHEVYPERVQVWADGQGKAYRHWGYGTESVEHYCTISVVGRRNGLHVGTSRTVSFGNPPKKLRSAHLDTLLVQATGMFFSQNQWEVYETWNRVERIYEKFGNSEEWHFSDQGCVTGYNLCEAPIVPKSEFRLATGMPVYWHSSIGPALSTDTILIGNSAFEVMTPMENWPQVEIDVKGVKVPRPDVLIRPE